MYMSVFVYFLSLMLGLFKQRYIFCFVLRPRTHLTGWRQRWIVFECRTYVCILWYSDLYIYYSRRWAKGSSQYASLKCAQPQLLNERFTHAGPKWEKAWLKKLLHVQMLGKANTWKVWNKIQGHPGLVTVVESKPWLFINKKIWKSRNPAPRGRPIMQHYHNQFLWDKSRISLRHGEPSHAPFFKRVLLQKRRAGLLIGSGDSIVWQWNKSVVDQLFRKPCRGVYLSSASSQNRFYRQWGTYGLLL